MIERLNYNTTSYSNKKILTIYFGLYTLFKITLEIVYVLAIYPRYSYMAYVLSINWSKCLASYILLYLIILVLPKQLSVAGQILNIFFSVSVIPLLSYYWLADKNTIYMFYSALFFLIMCFLLRKKPKPLVVINGTKQNYQLIMELLFVIYLFLGIYLGMVRGGIDTRAFSFNTIYDLRSDATTIGTLNGYLVSWCTKSFFPLLTVYYLYKKKRTRLLLCVLMQTFLYLCFGFKAYLLSIVFVLTIYFIGEYANRRYKESNFRNIFLFIALLIPSFFSWATGAIGKIGFSINANYAMRMLFEPAKIKFGYFEFFSDNSKLFFSEGIIGKILGLDYPYSEPIGFVITRYLSGPSAVSNSNTGIISDAYANLGVIGIIVLAITTALIIRLIERLTYNLPNYFVAGALSYQVVMLNDNPLLTNILTNGWAISIILLAVVARSLGDDIKFSPIHFFKDD